MPLTFDPEYKILKPISQLIGKTISKVIPIEAPGETPDGWIIEFTDGDRVELDAHYDDSEVFWMEPSDTRVFTHKQPDPPITELGAEPSGMVVHTSNCATHRGSGHPLFDCDCGAT